MRVDTHAIVFLLSALFAGCRVGAGEATDAGFELSGRVDAGLADVSWSPRDAAPSDASPLADAGADAKIEADAGLEGDAGEAETTPDSSTPPDSADGGSFGPDTGPRVVILMVGDGMGRGQIESASRFAHGRPGALYMHQLPHHGEIVTASLSGLTDSAASATAMATGVKTTNRRIGMDRERRPLKTLVELAHEEGLVAGIVTTALLPHATPGSFSAHWPDRDGYADIASSQVIDVQPEVLLGGGARYFLPAGADSARRDEGLMSVLANLGYELAFTRDALLAANATNGRLFGAFAPEHLDYVLDRNATTTQPTLEELSLAAIRVLERHSAGFFLMIEGARIDMASHGNDLARAVSETLDFDAAVAAVSSWARSNPHVTLLVTADHECGGLKVTGPRPAGQLSDVTWEWGQHTNARVDIFGQGPGAENFDGQVLDNTWVHAVAAARLEGRPVRPPQPGLVPDGRVVDLRHRAATQLVESGFGPAYNRLDALWVDADEAKLAIGLEGLFQAGENAVTVLIDVDLGMSTGPASMRGALGDLQGRADTILTRLNLLSPAVQGFGADFAAVAWGGVLARDEDLLADTGLRGLRPPFGQSTNLRWFAVPVNFGEGVRPSSGTPAASRPSEGLEFFVPWSTLYPNLGGGVPPGAALGLSVVMVNSDGGFTSNQALPAFAPMATNPGRMAVRLPGVVRFVVDSDGNGVADGDLPPRVLP